MAGSIEEIKKAQKLYLVIGGILFLGTILTVMVATVEWMDVGEHGFDKWDAVLGFTIAGIKASLVMIIFMHLNHEKPLVYFFYILGIVMAIFCMFLIGWAKSDPTQYGNPNLSDGFYNPDKPATNVHGSAD